MEEASANPPEKPTDRTVAENKPKPAEKPIHFLHTASAWFATCWADPPRALRQLEKGLKDVKGGHWIKTLIGVGVIGAIVCEVCFRSSDGAYYSANNNVNSPVIQGSPGATIYPPDNPLDHPIVTATAVVTFRQTSNSAPSMGHALFPQSGIGFFNKQGQPLLIAVDNGDSMIQVADGVQTVTLTCSLSQKSAYLGKPVKNLRDAAFIAVQSSPYFSSPTEIIGGDVRWVINEIPLNFTIPPQISNRSCQISTADLNEGFKPLSLIPDKSASPP